MLLQGRPPVLTARRTITPNCTTTLFLPTNKQRHIFHILRLSTIYFILGQIKVDLIYIFLDTKYYQIYELKVVFSQRSQG